MPSLADYLKELGLEPGATPKDVKRAYRELAKAWHPDKYGHSGKLRARCEARMRALNEAYEALRRVPKEELAELRPEPKAEPPPPEEWARRREPPPPEPGDDEVEEPEAPRPGQSEPWLDLWRGRKGPPRSKAAFWRRAAIDEPDYAGLKLVGGGFLVATLVLLALLWGSEATRESFAPLARMAVGLSCLYGAYFAASRNYWEFAFVLALIAAIFNPVFPVELRPVEWRVALFVLPALLIYIWSSMFGRESRKG